LATYGIRSGFIGRFCQESRKNQIATTQSYVNSTCLQKLKAILRIRRGFNRSQCVLRSAFNGLRIWEGSNPGSQIFRSLGNLVRSQEVRGIGSDSSPPILPKLPHFIFLSSW
jgi:hypothetical protein